MTEDEKHEWALDVATLVLKYGRRATLDAIARAWEDDECTTSAARFATDLVWEIDVAVVE